MADDPRPIVIVGAGLSGGKAAVTLREEGYDGGLVLVGDEDGVPFGRPPLSKEYLRGDGAIDGWLVKPEEWYSANRVERVRGHVTAVDPVARRLTLEDSAPIGYSRLLIASGGRNRAPKMPGADLDGVLQLRTVADCDAIRAAAGRGVQALVVGMGFIGSEVTASLRALGVEVTAVFDGAAPLERVLGPEVAGAFAATHREHGVRLLAGDRVAAFEGGDGRLRRAVTEKGQRIECDLAVVAVGIQPNVEFLAGSGVETENGVLVDARCQASVPGVFAAGDVATQLHPLFGRVRVEHYNNAEKQGAYAARSMLGKPGDYHYLHTFWSDQYEDKLEYAGHAAKWDQVAIRGDLEGRRFLAFYLSGGRLRAAAGLNRGGDPELEANSELAGVAKLIASGAELSPADLADEGRELPGPGSSA
jgi:3-phenylpropionate/trans-cinnamate dioxygenase ferredoxin reductase component